MLCHNNGQNRFIIRARSSIHVIPDHYHIYSKSSLVGRLYNYTRQAALRLTVVYRIFTLDLHGNNRLKNTAWV